ncbi:UNVERIFIED_CONTAM: hypothetical protein Slati_0146300 [Sesamum latifolium]|uniref:Uncharacterized protein n=1 Tax=Sesamum latifolium TaxID=2727402 RepID=A0AAW2Y9S7_9LAMI
MTGWNGHFSEEVENEGRLMGVAVAARAPRVTFAICRRHVGICEANEIQLEEIHSILSRYQKASDQVINFQKSNMIVGGFMPSSQKAQLAAILEYDWFLVMVDTWGCQHQVGDQEERS